MLKRMVVIDRGCHRTFSFARSSSRFEPTKRHLEERTSVSSLRLSTRAAALAVAASGAIFSIPAVSSASTVRAGAATTGCSLPVVHDVYDGFHVGVPAGWDLSTLGGQITVAPSPTSSEGAVLYPALLTKGVTAASVFSAFMRHEQKLVQGEKAVFNYLTRTGPGGLPAASVTAKINGTALSGQASVTVLPLGTQQASREAVVSLDYAPASQWAGAAGTLTSIGRCYGAERGALFAVFQGNPFTFIMPPGWHVGPEGQDYVELENSGNTASATYELWGPFVQGVNVSQPLSTPAQAISFWFGKFGFQGVHLLSAITAGADLEYSEFTATLSGKAVHGLIYMNISTSGQTTDGVFRLALAAGGLWNPLNGALIQMVGSIQHNFSQDLQEIQAVNRQWQDFSGQVANFDDTLNNQQLVQDPTTGKFYEAPYSSYIVDGQDGPGYYLPNDQRLNPVERP